MTSSWWGKEISLMAWGILVYEWAYLPVARYVFHLEGWSPTAFAFCAIGTAVAFNLVQLSIYGWPRERLPNGRDERPKTPL